MDNIIAMSLFLESVDIPSSAIVINDRAQVVLEHPDFNYLAVIDSHGLGGFFSHGLDISFVKKVNESYELFSPEIF